MTTWPCERISTPLTPTFCSFLSCNIHQILWLSTVSSPHSTTWPSERISPATRLVTFTAWYHLPSFNGSWASQPCPFHQAKPSYLSMAWPLFRRLLSCLPYPIPSFWEWEKPASFPGSRSHVCNLYHSSGVAHLQLLEPKNWKKTKTLEIIRMAPQTNHSHQVTLKVLQDILADKCQVSQREGLPSCQRWGV